MIKLVVGLTAAAIAVVGLASIHGGRNEPEATGQMRPLQMMVNQQPLSSERPNDLSVVFEQAPETGN